MVMSAKTGIVQLKISRNQGGGETFQAHALPLLGVQKICLGLEMLWQREKWQEIQKKKKKKGLFGEARLLTTSHLVVWVIIL